MTGPVDFAIDGKEETAWGIDAGPGLRNQPRKAVFNAAEPIANRRAARILTFYLQQNHGGWNSDDNQTQQSGPISLVHHRSPGCRGRSAARRLCGRCLPFRRTNARPTSADRLQLLARDSPGMERGE